MTAHRGAPLPARILYLVTEDWYFCSHRLPVARAARDAGFDVVVVTRIAEEAERIRRERFRVHSLDMRRGEFSPVHDFGTLVRLMKILKLERPGIIHNIALKPVVLGTLAARLTATPAIINALAGLGYIFTSRDARAGWLRQGIRLAFRILLRSPAVGVIVQNSSDRGVIESFGVSAKRIALIAGSGVDISTYQPSPEADGSIGVAMVSRMLWPKGVGEFVEAARLVHEKYQNVRFILVGAPDPANPSSVDEKSMKQWSNEGIVECAGPVPGDEIPSIWRQAHVGVLPSYYGEGVPKSLLEAGACGRPLIAADVPGCRDVVVHEKTGLLVPPRNPKALAEAIIRLVEDPALRERLGKAACERVEAHFSVEKVVAETLALYRSVLTTA